MHSIGMVIEALEIALGDAFNNRAFVISGNSHRLWSAVTSATNLGHVSIRYFCAMRIVPQPHGQLVPGLGFGEP
jgi:hypothetical protein